VHCRHGRRGCRPERSTSSLLAKFPPRFPLLLHQLFSGVIRADLLSVAWRSDLTDEDLAVGARRPSQGYPFAIDDDFLAGYCEVAGPLVLTSAMGDRPALYRTYLYLFMLIEVSPIEISGEQAHRMQTECSAI
jgi:hypothetical protein